MPEDETFLRDYVSRYQKVLAETTPAVFEHICAFRDEAVRVRECGNKLIFAGNGASASISSHFAVDFTKQGSVRAVDFNEANLITCFANDYGYEYWLVEAIRAYADAGDVIVLTSSSGRSPNVVNAARHAREAGLKVVSFTGFQPDNPLRQASDISFWVDSRSYNIVECIHMIWGTMVIDLLIGKIEYSVC